MAIERDLLPLREEVDAKRPEVGSHDGAGKAPRTRRRVLQQARRLRNGATSSEKRLWSLLRRKGVGGIKFRRQGALGPYIVDFVCLWPRLVVEVDGGIHRTEFYDRERELRRDAWLRSQGFIVLRFSDREIEDDPVRVLDVIARAANRTR